MFKYLLTISLFIGVLTTNAQTNKYFDDIKKTFDNKSQSELDKISKALKTAQKDFDEGEKLYSEKNISKALSKSKKASSVFKTTYKELYTLYENKLNSVIKEAEGDQKNYFRKKIQDSKNYFRVAIYNRLKAGEEKDDKIIYDLLTESHKNEILAISSQSEIFAALNGWENIDYTVEETNYNPKTNFENTNTQNYNGHSFSVNNPSLLNSYKFNHIVVETNDNGEVIADNSNVNNTDVYETNTNNSNVARYHNNSDKIKAHEFRIQIGTSILPANQEQLKRLNSTNLPVSTYKSNIYYKYTIGSFKDFQEAKNFKNAYGLTKVYITEYKNGKEVKFYIKDYQ